MPRLRRFTISGIILLSIASGCREKRDPNATPLPDADSAKKAIVATFETWKAGHTTGKVEPTTPRILVNDSFRKPGQVVESYEILGTNREKRAVTFTVKVTLSNPEETQNIRFYLLGIDPVIVFRQEDYDLMSHWEHKMDPEPEEPAT